MKKSILLLTVLVVIVGQAWAARQQNPIRVLIFSGSNNHNWKATTPCLQEIYADSGRFVADVLDDPSKCTEETLKNYDVVVSNWTAFPDVKGRQWGADTEKALMDFVRSGKGFAVIHAASTCFNGWVEYHQMVGATWGKKTGHGSIHQFEVTVTDKDHPITKGMKDFRVTDELWHRMETLQPTPSQKVLCKAFSAKDKGGSGQMEKVAMCSRFGRGRCFYNILGHDVRAMKSTGWKQLMLRGTEWAATGKVAADQPVKSADQLIAQVGNNPAARKKLESDMINLLKSDATFPQKQKALRILAVVGTVDSIEALAALLPDKNLAHMARYALEPMPYPQAGIALRDALNKTSGQAKVGVIQSIGVRRDKEAVPVLIALLGDSDTKIANAAAWALGRTGTPRAAVALAKLYANGPVKLRSAALDALLTAADSLVQQGKLDDAADVYEQLQAAGGSRHVRMSAFSGLLRAKPHQAVSILLMTMADEDPAMQRLAIANIATLEGANVSKRFATELPGFSPDAQVLLIDALTQRKDPVVVPAITAAASHNNIAVRSAAVKALGDIGGVSSVDVLVNVMAAGKGDQSSQAAASSLRRLTAKGTVDAIVKSMKNSKGPLRASLIDVLRDRNATDTVPALLTEAASNDSKVQRSALKALADMASPANLPALIKLLVGMNNNQARRQAERPVVAVSLKIEDQTKRADATLKALRSAKDTPTRCSLLRVLSGIGNEDALVAVSNATADSSSAVQDTAVRALAGWPNAIAVAKLVEVYSTTDNNTHRVVALRGSVRLLAQGGLSTGQALNACQTLMKDAKSTQEKKLVLARLANVADPAALDMVEPLLTDKQINAEAELALIGIARKIMATSPNQAKAAAQKLLKTSKNKSIRDQAAEILKQLE